MKKIFVLVFLSFQMAAVSGARADFVGGDQQYLTVDCSSVNISFSSNVQVQIKEGGLAGITTAQIKSQEGPAPVLNLGPIEAHEVFRQPGIDGAPLIYKGEGFELSIDTDGASNERGYYSTLNADIDGHVFNNATLYCQLYAHAL